MIPLPGPHDALQYGTPGIVEPCGQGLFDERLAEQETPVGPVEDAQAEILMAPS